MHRGVGASRGTFLSEESAASIVLEPQPGTQTFIGATQPRGVHGKMCGRGGTTQKPARAMACIRRAHSVCFRVRYRHWRSPNDATRIPIRGPR